MTVTEHNAAALEFLRRELGAAAPDVLAHEATFDEDPLEGEGTTSIFGFEAEVGGGERQKYWVVAGRTEPNYYPHWNLNVQEVYDLHIGTRFMLVMEVGAVPVAELPAGWSDAVRAFIRSAAPGESIDALEPAAAFRVGDEVFLICRARIANEETYVLGLDCPPAIYRDTALPPHVVFRRHLGALIRYEARREASERV